MPKVLIREYDKSITGTPASDNFAVVVPGYFGTPAKNPNTGENFNPKDLLIDHDVYELKSLSDFNKYIGKRANTSKEATPPILHVVNGLDDSMNDYTKCLMRLELSDFNEYLEDTEPGAHFYRVTELNQLDDRHYSHYEDGISYGYLYTTIEYYNKTLVETQVEGEGGTTTTETSYVNSGTPQKVTIALTKIDSFDQVDWIEVTEGEGENEVTKIVSDSTKAMYCKISVGEEGTTGTQETQMGNQIAYELLGLGYTVLYKKLDEATEGQRLSDLDGPAFWEPLKDKSIFNFRYVMTGGYYSASAMNRICELAKFNNNAKLEEAETYGNLSGRGDCIALCDIDETIPGTTAQTLASGAQTLASGLSLSEILTAIGNAAKRITKTNEYSAIFAPKVTYVMADDEVEPWGKNKTFPASFHYLACAARTFDRYNEWYAVAGYNRGISNYAIETTSVKLGEIAVNTLAPRILNTYTNKSINLILHERGNYYLWGNRTGYALNDNGIVFHHFLNIRQLCCSIKKQLYTACRQFTFDPNSDLLWINFVNAIKPTLEAMKADQGIKGYTISRVANDKKALLTARIRIVPIEAVEDFDISIYLEDSLTGIVVSADETQA